MKHPIWSDIQIWSYKNYHLHWQGLATHLTTQQPHLELPSLNLPPEPQQLLTQVSVPAHLHGLQHELKSTPSVHLHLAQQAQLSNLETIILNTNKTTSLDLYIFQKSSYICA